MSETNKTYRIKTEVGKTDGYINIDTNLVQDYDTLDILSVKISNAETYKLHNSNYGVVVGRVLANNGFGVPNAKISIFIEADSKDGDKVRELYPFANTYSKDSNGVRYNLLPDEKVSDCHQVVGTFPNKRYMLDNDIVLEVFDKYYKYTTRTNNGGDYLIMGVPVGTYTLHMDLDLSDCGILSQKPRDFVYKGYTIEQFENPSKFKEGKEYNELSQVFTQDQTVNVIPFWGNETIGEQIGITRADINVAFKFETTCVFIGSVMSDNASNGITKKCMATDNMGNMEEMTTGEGTIEMIRKTPSGEIEEFQVRGTQLIDSNGVWCYQIPMNLDYMMTDEYGNMVPTDDPEKGIPTRTSVRFRISMQDNEENTDNFFRAKVLVPHNPQFIETGEHEEYDYEFGTYTRDDSFRDLFWDNVYSVKSYIPRFQKRKVKGWKETKFTGIKSCNFHGNNNPMPYNNMRIKLPLMFTIMCTIIKCFIKITGIFNTFISSLGNFLSKLGVKKINLGFGKIKLFPKAMDTARELRLNVISEGLCPDLENWYFAPMRKVNLERRGGYDLLGQTMNHLLTEEDYDSTSIDYQNSESEDEVICLTTSIDYLISCIEMNLAMEYRVINFDFYNDWINGTIYIPRFMRYLRPKKTFLGITFAKAKIKGCMDNTRIFSKTRRYTQQCSLGYKSDGNIYSKVDNPLARNSNKRAIKKSNNFHKKNGFTQQTIFGKKGGICHEHTTSRKQYVYYMKPCEWLNNSKVNLFATDLILLGSLKDCDENGLPKAFRYLSSTSYIMPTNLALTNMETNGPLYVNNNGTICAGSSSQMLNENNMDDDKGVQYVDTNEGIGNELSVYANSKDSNIDTQYDGTELSDIIPLTEAAGIAWNYTGPGQGKIVEKNMYYPGGHFLGMSCTNSQTNIKSCVNLSRICEAGVTMSQRKEDISSIDENGNEIYTYTAPTGFISGNEIVGEDFRTMFATMNQNRLQANKLNIETGYYYYNFDFVKPINFNGIFNDIVKKGDTAYYNTKIEIPKENYELLESFGISAFNRTQNRPDYDENESLNTQTRTIEDSSKDYYKFRFGLTEKNLKKTDAIHNGKFLKSIGGYSYLPQYENSYYFYFGMKAGATAIDEFNKQFFSVCEPTVIKNRMATINIDIDNIDICEQNANTTVIVDNVEMPLQVIKLYKETENGVIEYDLHDKKNIKGKEYRNLYSFKLSNDFNDGVAEADTLPFGKYHLEIVDSNGLSLTKDFVVGVDLFSFKYEIYDFNIYDSDTILASTVRDEYLGGYIKIIDVLINENYRDKVKKNIEFRTQDYNCSGLWYEYIVDEDDNLILNGYPSILYANSANTVYHLYLRYQCLDSAEWKEVYLEDFTVNDGKTIGLNMGNKNLPIYISITPSGASKITYPYLNDNKIEVKSENDVEPYLNFGGTKWWPENKTYGNSIILGRTSGDGEVIKDEHKVTIEIEGKEDDIYGGGGNGTSGGNKPQGSMSTGFEPGIYEPDEPLSDSGIYKDHGDSYGNWLKRVSIFKSTPKTDIFSNNIFSTNGNKILWGKPQNINGSLPNVYCSEFEVDAGYTLDDDASYHGTEANYSSIGVNDKGVVSGNYFAKLSNGNISNSGCFGQWPSSGDGYVFKSIPDGEIVYLTYNGSVEKPEGYDKGVYYASFKYPVIEAPMKIRTNFFIWNEIGIYFPENEDGTPEIIYNEMAGRTEMQIENGIRYKQNLGATKIESDGEKYIGLDVSNIKLADLRNATVGKRVANHIYGMDVTVTDGNGGESIIPAYDDSEEYAIGVTGISEAHYEITEGYPYINDKVDFSMMVAKISDSFNYNGYFGDYVTYENKPGDGINVTIQGSNKGGGRGFVCLQKSNSKFRLLEQPDGNDGYIFKKGGSTKKPDYWVLCRIKKYDDDIILTNKIHELNGRINEIKEELEEENDGATLKDENMKLASEPGKLFIMYIHYYTNKKFNVRWSFDYKYIITGGDEDEEIVETKSTTWDLRKDSKASKTDMKNAKNSLKAIYDIMIKAMGSERCYFEFVENYRINKEVIHNYEKATWWDTIQAHANNYGKDKREINLNTGDIVYYVDRMPLQTSSNGMGEAGLFKIYPVLLEKNAEDDGIELSRYGVAGRVTDLDANFVINNQTGKTVDLTITYEITHTNNDNVYKNDKLTAKDKQGALERLRVEYNEGDRVIGNISSDNWNIKINSSTAEYVEASGIYNVEYNITLSFNMTTNGIDESIRFYITNPANGENFSIYFENYEVYLFVYKDKNLIEKIENVVDFGSEYASRLSDINEQVFYVGYKDVKNEGLDITVSTTNNNFLFTAATTTTEVIDGVNYRIKPYIIGVNTGLISGDYNTIFNFYVVGFNNDSRYKASIITKVNVISNPEMYVSPSEILVYTKGKEGCNEPIVLSSNTELNDLLESYVLGTDIFVESTSNWGGFDCTKSSKELTFTYNGSSEATIGQKYEYKITTSYDDIDCEAKINCIASPYVYVKLHNYKFDKNIYGDFDKKNVRMTDIMVTAGSVLSDVVVSEGDNVDIIPDSNDIENDVLNLSITYRKKESDDDTTGGNPYKGLYYITRKEKGNFNFYTENKDENVYLLDNIGPTDFSASGYPSWDIELPIEYYKPSYSNGIYNVPQLYVRRVDIGDNYILKLINNTGYNLKIKTFRGTQVIEKDVEIEINFSGVTLNEETFKLFQLGAIVEEVNNASILGANVNTKVLETDVCVFDSSIKYTNRKQKTSTKMNNILGANVNTSIELGSCKDEEPNCGPTDLVCVCDGVPCPKNVILCDCDSAPNTCDCDSAPNTCDCDSAPNTCDCDSAPNTCDSNCICNNVDNNYNSIPDGFECGKDTSVGFYEGIIDEFEVPDSPEEKDKNKNYIYDIYECGADEDSDGLINDYDPDYVPCPCVSEPCPGDGLECNPDCPCDGHDSTNPDCPDTGDQGELNSSISYFYITRKPQYDGDKVYDSVHISQNLGSDTEDADTMPFGTYLSSLCVKGDFDNDRNTYIGTAIINVELRN